MIEKEFTVPSYYKDFACKGNACRNCCCDGWAVTVSLREYFALLSLECREETRKKLDIALHVLRDADESRYAQILPAFDGTCPLRRKEDGFCALQCECGESSLPAVCRYYPRSPRLFPAPECCVSNSCERVLEVLVSDDEKLTFEKAKLSFYFDAQENKIDASAACRQTCFELLENREKPLEGRIDDIRRYLSGEENDSRVCNVADGYAKELLEFYTQSPSIGEDCASALKREYSAAECLKKVAEKFPRREVMMEKILANHFFFTKFPYPEENEKPSDVGNGLVGLCLLWHELLAEKDVLSTEDFIDVTSKLFRVTEHTRFYKNAAVLLNRVLLENKV